MGQSKKILIVEDDLPVQKVLVVKLKKRGFDVMTAIDGEAGLALALEHKPDMILLDIVMPKMDGMTMLHKLREDSWGKGAKVAILTNLVDADKAEEAAANGVYDFLVKSNWKLESLVKLIKEKL